MAPLYVYGIIADSHPATLAELRAVGPDPAAPISRTGTDGVDVVAVTSEAPADLRGKRRDLLAHQEVLNTLAGQGPVLPMRFGLVVPDVAALTASLRANADHYQRLLADVAGHAEWNVKAVPDEQAFLSAAAEDPSVRAAQRSASHDGSRDRQIELGRAVADAMSRRRLACGTQILDQLRPYAARTAAAGDTGRYAMNAAFLVKARETQRFLDALDQLTRQTAPAVELIVTGPLPAYSFVGGEAWA